MRPEDIYSGSNLSLDHGIAENLGYDSALVFNHIVYWLKINAIKPDVQMVDGRYWMYETQKQISEFFGFLSEEQVSKAIKKLLEAGLLIKANHNKNPFDRTSWYTVFNQQIIKKSLRNPEIGGMQPRKSAESEPRKSAECIYDQQNINIDKQQQDAAVFSEKEKGCPVFYSCLIDIDIPEPDKIWITEKYSQEVVVNAIEWAIHPITKIKTSLVQAIKWGCQNEAKPPKNKDQKIEENKAHAQTVESCFNSDKQHVMACNKYIEIGIDPKPSYIDYDLPIESFKSLVKEALEKWKYKKLK